MLLLAALAEQTSRKLLYLLFARKFSACPPCNGRQEHYLIVACTVIADVPEAVDP
jgi:hypothetical protein